MEGHKRDAKGGWRSERDANGAANVTFGAGTLTPYQPPRTNVPSIERDVLE